MEDDRSYYARRADEQRRAAEQAESEEARRRHLELAELLKGQALSGAAASRFPPRVNATVPARRAAPVLDACRCPPLCAPRIQARVATIAQLVRAPVCGTGGRGFKSRWSPHLRADIGQDRLQWNSLWDFPDFDEHELVHFVTDRDTGLKAVIAVHSTHLGPGGGRHPLLALCRARRRDRRRAAPVARDELQERHGRACRWAAARR